MKGMGQTPSIGKISAAEYERGKCPNLCRGGSQTSECVLVEKYCGEPEIVLHVILPLHHHHPSM